MLNVPSSIISLRVRTVIDWCSRRLGRSTTRAETPKVVTEQAQQCQYDFPIFPPPPPQEILDQRSNYVLRLRARKFRVPAGISVDTPLHTLFRLYEFLVVDHVTGYRNQLEYFWKQRDWSVRDLPDPDDDDPYRYAFLACIPALIVSAFNAKIKLGLPRDAPSIISPEQAEEFRNRPESSKLYEEVPNWTKHVRPAPSPLYMRSHDDVTMSGSEDPRASEFFKPMNILIWGPHIHFT